ncbi:type III toxin-antitoxin system ToxN/AbiQ family toxin [Streptococcus suis]|nr:type III toxin-antitoxin system ToxN/AbiQ family toxin [Streptococcus suis]NQJ53299.1 type III toxin-antitoxin system ToxN/AbiQ family toxin [Streptococcus suis]NQJ57668.1 type III toxin-antitoxin system ToxN/AbiQ family toxin [Streptococcus suis]
MHEMKFYQIDTNYLNMLRQIDGRVPHNKEFIGRKGKSRPYIGVMLSIDGIDYSVPLSSQKKRSSYVMMPIYDDNNNQIATLMLNNMLPVPSKYRKLLNMDGVKMTDPKYFDLLMNELNFLRPRKDSIKSRCAIIRSVKVEGKNKPQINERTKEFCLELTELEKAYKENE